MSDENCLTKDTVFRREVDDTYILTDDTYILNSVQEWLLRYFQPFSYVYTTN